MVPERGRFSKNCKARLVLVVSSPEVLGFIDIDQCRRSKAADLDQKEQKKCIWSVGGPVENDFNNLEKEYTTPKGIKDIVDNTNTPVDFQVNRLWEQGSDFFYSGPFLKNQYYSMKRDYTKAAGNFHRSGQNDPKNFSNFVASGDVAISFYHMAVMDLASLPGGQSLTRGLPAGCGAEEGCGETTDGISELPKRKNRRVLELPDEDLGGLVKAATGYFQRSSEPPKAILSKVDRLHQAGCSIFSLMKMAKDAGDDKCIHELKEMAYKTISEMKLAYDQELFSQAAALRHGPKGAA